MSERVLEFDPANRDAYERVLSLYSDAGDWRAYSQAVDRYLPNLVTDEDKIKALRELGRIREQKLGQQRPQVLQGGQLGHGLAYCAMRAAVLAAEMAWL